MLKTRFVLTAAVAAVFSATPLLAQTQPAAPAQPPAVTQPTMPAPASQPQSSAGTPVPASPQMPSAVPAPQAAPLAPPASVSDSERSTAVMLLDRIQQVLDKAADGKTEEVRLDRGLLDEIRAEVTQVKLTLQRPKQ